MEPTNTQPNIPEPIPTPPQSSSKKWIVIGAIVILILGAGVYYYQSNKGSTKTMDIQETNLPVENDSAVVTDTQQKDIKPSVTDNSSDIEIAKSELLKIALIVKNKDILKAKTYFEQNGMSDWVQIMSDNKAVAESKLEGLGQSTLLENVNSESVNDTSIKWSKGEPLGDAKAVVFGDNFKAEDGSLVCRQIIEQNSKGEWFWVGASCS